MISPIRSLVLWARMVKLSHTAFALPFAFAGAALAAFRYGYEPRQLLWIALAMIGARNAAMGFNRLVDQKFDAANPRTKTRELPAGTLSSVAVATVTFLLAALFVFSAFQLNRLCGILSLPALVVILGYSFVKRFHWASHLVLGFALSIAPMGGWLAIRGQFDPLPLILSLAVALWVAGFDVLYACQDADFDRGHGLHSIPAHFGIKNALRISRGLHLLSWLTMIVVGIRADMFPVYGIGLVVIGGLLLHEHRLVKAEDLSRVGVAFLNLNATIAVLYLVTVLVSGWVQ